MKVLFVGDTHCNSSVWTQIADVAVGHGCELIWQVGDFGYQFPEVYIRAVQTAADTARVPVMWIRGNHDNRDTIRTLSAGQQAGPVALWPTVAPDVLYVPDGTVVDVAGVRVLGVGGAVSIDQDRRVPYVSWWPDETISPADIAAAAAAGPVDVVVAHDAPYGCDPLEGMLEDTGISDRLLRASASNRKAVAAIVDRAAPRLVVHGHYHHRYDGRYQPGSGPDVTVCGLGADDDPDRMWAVYDLRCTSNRSTSESAESRTGSGRTGTASGAGQTVWRGCLRAHFR